MGGTARRTPRLRQQRDGPRSKVVAIPSGTHGATHSLEQLVSPDGVDLYLVFCRLESVPTGGDTVASLVDELVGAGSDEAQLMERLSSASAVGELLDPNPRMYRRTERRIHRVDAEFPKLTGADVPAWPRKGLTYVRYGLDLREAGTPLEDQDGILLLESLGA